MFEDFIQRIENEADPIGFLISIANGQKFVAAPSTNSADVIEVYPTLDQRLKAQLILEKRLYSPEGREEEGVNVPTQQEIEELRHKLTQEVLKLSKASPSE